MSRTQPDECAERVNAATELTAAQYDARIKTLMASAQDAWDQYRGACRERDELKAKCERLSQRLEELSK